jgi:hypothetical protein
MSYGRVLRRIFVMEVMNLGHTNLFSDKRILIHCLNGMDAHRAFLCEAEIMIDEEQISCIHFNVLVQFSALHRWPLYMLSLSVVIHQCSICAEHSLSALPILRVFDMHCELRECISSAHNKHHLCISIGSPLSHFSACLVQNRLCDLMVRVPGYRPRGPGSIPGATRFSEK